MPGSCTGPSPPHAGRGCLTCGNSFSRLWPVQQAEADATAMEESQPVAPAPAKRPKHNTWGLGQVRISSCCCPSLSRLVRRDLAGACQCWPGGQDCAQQAHPLCMFVVVGGV